MKKLFKAARLVTYNFKALLAFEIFYKAISSLLFTPLILAALSGIMKVSGYSYLTFENIGSFILKPLTLAALLMLVILAAVYAMIDISAVVFALDQSMQKQKVCLRQIIRFSVANAFRVMNPQNMLMIITVLLLMPFLNIGLASGFISTVSIPEFILDYIKSNIILYVLFGLFVLILLIIAGRRIYAFHYFTLEKCSFREAKKRSAKLGEGRRIRDFAAMIAAQLIFAGIYILFVLLMTALASLVGRIFSNIFVLRWISSTFIWLTLALSFAVATALSVPVGYSFVSILFYVRKSEAGEMTVHSTAPECSREPRFKKQLGIVKIVLGITVTVASLITGLLIYTGKINSKVEYVRKMEVTAHRGASAFYPENTMAAFEGAEKLGADWIELDVQQSKDGSIIVIHDTNFQRTTGVNANTWELTYDEISKLDGGSFFSDEYAGERIPLLSEVVDFAKEKGIKLNIELKPTGREKDFEKCVVDIIKDADFVNSCVITSQVYSVLENVKAYDGSVTTVYVMSFAYGDINKLSAADSFSIEASSITKTMISRVHKAGKKIYAWTVNTKESITKMAEMNVDNIITDDIELAKQCVYESRYSSLIEEYIKLFR